MYEIELWLKHIDSECLEYWLTYKTLHGVTSGIIMAEIKQPSSLSLEGENWRQFKQHFELYLVATGKAQEENKITSSLFLHIIEEDALEIYNTFEFAEEKDRQYLKVLYPKFEEYRNPHKNVTYEWHIFNTRVQQENESIDQYVADLRRLAKSREFDTQFDLSSQTEPLRQILQKDIRGSGVRRKKTARPRTL